MCYKFEDFKDDYDQDEDYIGREDDLSFMHSLCTAFGGDVSSMRVLGEIYSSSGHGVVTDYNKAIFWYNRAVECGDKCSAQRLADIYYFCEGVPQDHKRAFELYEIAAEDGNAAATARLGTMCLYGRGCKKDFDRARVLLEKAAKENEREALYEYAHILRDGGAEDQFDILKKSADNSYAPACWELIESFSDILDDKRFLLYLTYAANGSAYGYDRMPARLMLADCFMHGKRVKKNVDYARSYYISAAEDGSEEAKELLIKYFGFY